MYIRKLVLGCIGTVTAVALLVGCNDDQVSTGDTGTSSSTHSARPSASAGAGHDTGADQKPNPALFDKAAPCTLVTPAGMKAVFKTTFSPLVGGVVDSTEQTRNCGYEVSDAYLDHGDSYSRDSISVIIETKIDDANSSIWQADLNGGGSRALIPGVPEAIHVGPGWYQARKGQVIVEVSDIYTTISDKDAIALIQAAMKKL